MKLPTQRKVLLDDLPADVPKWIFNIVRQVNQFLQVIISGLDKQLNFVENVSANVVQMQVQTTAGSALVASISIENNFKRNPLGVFIISAVEPTDPIPYSLGNPAWVLNGSQIVISSISNLPASKLLNIRFLII